jgi:hypothetical protein
VPTDQLTLERKEQLKQFVFWTAVAVVGGFVVLRVVPRLV